MRLSLICLAMLTAGACSPTMGQPRHLPVNTVVMHAAAGVTAPVAAATVADANAHVALVAGPADGAWFAALADAAGLHLSGPALVAHDLGLAFLGREPVGDTTIELTYDGGRFLLHDALYEVRERRFLDLLAFRVDDAPRARAMVASLVDYMATDVMHNAAVILAVAVPSSAAGDSVAAVLSPAFSDARRCGAAAGAAPGIRLFYGPEARIYCRTAEGADEAVGAVIRARLVLGRR